MSYVSLDWAVLAQGNPRQHDNAVCLRPVHHELWLAPTKDLVS